MKTLFLDCGMGAAGDMLTAALLELIPNREEFLLKLNSLGIPGVEVHKESVNKCGIQGTHISVNVDGIEESEDMHCGKLDSSEHVHIHNKNCHEENEHGHHHHHGNGVREIKNIVEKFSLSQKIKDDILNVFNLIAEAESQVHNRTIDEIHFHEVGTADAIADVTAVCMLMDIISPEAVVASPVHVGSGTVKCAHGILPVPAPATAYILKDVPIYGGNIKSELCTPTGAALLKYFVKDFGDMPVMKVTDIGYGMGKKDFAEANCLRAMLGETSGATNVVVELCCNVDDMTAEAIGFALEQFFLAGALDAYTTPIQMKKARPGILLSVMCRVQDREMMLGLIFKHTTTIGVRENISKRYILSRSTSTIETELGSVNKKISTGYGVTREKYEYEDLARIAREQSMSLRDVTEYVSGHELKRCH